MKTNSLFPFSRMAFSLLIGAVSIPAAAVAPTQNPTTIQVSYSGTIYNLTSKITSYNADSALLQSQPWWGLPLFAQGLATIVGSQLGEYTSYTSSGYINAFLAYSSSVDAYATQCAPCTNVNPNFPYNYVILSQPLITLSALSSSLSSTSQGLDVALASSSLMLNGAHSRPLSRLVATGKKTGWILGDWGRDDHGSRDGSAGLAELGGGYNFGPAQVNVSAGQTWSDQNLPNNGDVDYTGHYLMVEHCAGFTGARPVCHVRRLRPLG